MLSNPLGFEKPSPVNIQTSPCWWALDIIGSEYAWHCQSFILAFRCCVYEVNCIFIRIHFEYITVFSLMNRRKRRRRPTFFRWISSSQICYIMHLECLRLRTQRAAPSCHPLVKREEIYVFHFRLRSAVIALIDSLPNGGGCGVRHRSLQMMNREINLRC